MTKPRFQVAQPADTFVEEGAAFMSLTGWGTQARTTPDGEPRARVIASPAQAPRSDSM